MDFLLLGIQILLGSLLAGLLLAGCSTAKRDSAAAQNALEYTVVEKSAIPEELAKLISEKEKTPFKLSYSDGSSLFLAVGYGEQKSGGYSIQVKEFYLGENAIYLDTELLGPSEEEYKSGEPSMPYLVLQTEYREEPVVFQ
ncbi:MAG: protease complex subunit PrcB family protein [bacterium]|nr:protease complex subunit PrcB family protein [bacterium]